MFPKLCENEKNWVEKAASFYTSASENSQHTAKS